ncbi:MAG: hypothetical protein ACYSWS_03420 [Planctomycetota bacterium]|jgi:hypothetical protein
MIYSESPSEMIKKVRIQIAAILKNVDQFTVNFEAQLLAREKELDEQIKKYANYKEREKEFEEKKKKLVIREKTIQKQKQANRDKQMALNNKEKELNKTLERVKGILS